MEKKVFLLFCLFLGLNFMSVNAQKHLIQSFKDDFLAELYDNCPDSLKTSLHQARTPAATCSYSHIKTLDQMEHIIMQRYGDCFMLRYRTQDVCAIVRTTRDFEDFCLDFFYISDKDELLCLRLLNTIGTFNQSVRTKSGVKYVIDHAWGFINITENMLPLLNCYCAIDEENQELNLIPFVGTNTLVWSKFNGESFVPAF